MPFMKPYMVKLLREQFPPGTRIRLDSMMNDPQPIPKGMTGTVQGIDDAGQLLMEWDNGRGLSLVPGEDDFSVVKPQKLKLYMPLEIGYYEKNDWGDYGDEELALSDNDAVGYADTITGALERESKFLNTPRGFMEYYNRSDGIDAKVRSLFFKAEARNSKLWGVAECMVSGELNGEELAKLKDYIAGQASDGFGESVEQHEIRVGSMELYAHLWQAAGWSIQTEQECFAPKLAKGLPELCFSTLPSTGVLICIKRGESGYYPSDWNTPDRTQNRQIADEQNQRLGVTPAQMGAFCILQKIFQRNFRFRPAFKKVVCIIPRKGEVLPPFGRKEVITWNLIAENFRSNVSFKVSVNGCYTTKPVTPMMKSGDAGNGKFLFVTLPCMRNGSFTLRINIFKLKQPSRLIKWQEKK